MAAFLHNFSLAEFSDEEKRFVARTRVSQFLSSLNFNISSASALDMYMRHSGGSSTTMAVHYGTVQSSINLCNMLLAPAVGCLSDTIGRKPLMMFGRAGWALWWLVLANIDALSAATGLTQLGIRMLGEIVCWGIIQAGTWSAYTAAQADYFGTRPALMGKVGTTGGIVWDLGQFSGSIVGAWLAVASPKLSLYASAACALGTIVLFSTLKEPLAKDKRKPFRLLEANPIGSLGLLFSYGSGLKRLTAMTSLLYTQYDTWSVRNSYRLGAVGLSSSAISLLNTWAAACMMFSQGAIVIPLTQARGFPFAFKVGAIGGIIAYAMEGTSWIGATARTRLIHYVLAQTVYSGIFEICGHCIRPMVTKQGIQASKKIQQQALADGRPDPGQVGLGALSAAVNNLSSLLGVVSPIAWAWTYSFFDKGNPSAKALAAGARQNHWLFRWGKGGHLFIAAALLLLSAGVLHTAPKREMYLDEEDDKGKEGEGA